MCFHPAAPAAGARIFCGGAAIGGASPTHTRTTVMLTARSRHPDRMERRPAFCVRKPAAHPRARQRRGVRSGSLGREFDSKTHPPRLARKRQGIPRHLQHRRRSSYLLSLDRQLLSPLTRAKLVAVPSRPAHTAPTEQRSPIGVQIVVPTDIDFSFHQTAAPRRRSAASLGAQPPDWRRRPKLRAATMTDRQASARTAAR